MTITVTEKHGNRSASVNSKGQRSYTRTLQVVTDDHTTGPVQILASLGVARYDTYETDTELDYGSYLLEIDLSEVTDDGLGWEAVLKYQPLDPKNSTDDPLDQPPIVSGGFKNYQRIAHSDVNGDVIVNSAQLPPLNPVMADDSRLEFSVTANFAYSSFDPDTYVAYRDAVNSNTYRGRAAGTCKFMGLSFSEESHPDGITEDNPSGKYIKATFNFAVQPTWDAELLDEGLVQLIDGDWYHILSGGPGTAPVTEAVPLNGEGLALPPGQPYHTNVWQIYQKLNFNIFP